MIMGISKMLETARKNYKRHSENIEKGDDEMTFAAILGVIGCIGTVCVGISNIGNGALALAKKIKQRKEDKSEEVAED